MLHTTSYNKIKKIRDYFYEITYNDFDYNYALKRFKESFKDPVIGACSSIRKGNFYGRNFDFEYDDKAYFMVRTKPTKGRYGSIGMSGLKLLSEKVIGKDPNINSEEYKFLPFLLVDGINDNHVTCNLNIAQCPDAKPTTGTKPNIEKRYELCALMLVRFVLDNFGSAKETVDYIRNYVSVYATHNELMDSEYHLMVSDLKDTYLVEFFDNQTYVFKVGDDCKHKAIMTNFRIKNTVVDDNKLIRGTVDKYGAGLERYEYLLSQYDSINSVKDMIDTMYNIRYTLAYKETDPDKVWYTEFTGDYTEHGMGDLTVTTPREEYAAVLEWARNGYKKTTRFSTIKTWQTVHGCVYDILNKRMYLNVQEDYDNTYVYDLDLYTKQEVDEKIEEVKQWCLNKFCLKTE